MNDERELIEQIREYEINAAHARKTNEKELPQLKYIVDDFDKFEFGNEDQDLKKRMMDVASKISALEVVGIKADVLNSLRVEVSQIKDELVKRYRDRMEAYASRQSNL